MKESELELYRKHRPELFKQVHGQKEAVSVLMNLVKTKRVPHALVFTGPSGCGKTTLARILRKKLGCGDGDFQEINASDFRGIDTVRDLRTRVSLLPINGACRVCLIDEAHGLSKDAQNALLKLLEDTPSHFYFMLATTEPSKLLKTIQTRCTEIKLRELSSEAMLTTLKQVAARERLELEEEVLEKIVECAAGSARSALVLLNKLVGLEKAEHLEAVEKNVSGVEAIALARALIRFDTSWADVAVILKRMTDEPEQVRWLVLGYANSCLLSGGKIAERAAAIIRAFQFNYYDSKRAGLLLSCYEVVGGKR